MDTLQRQLSARWWRSLSKADRWALGVIVGLPIIVFAIPALLGYPAIAQDNLIQNFPLRALVGRDIDSGHLPLFNSLADSGTPLLGGMNAGAFFPLTWLFAALPAILSWVMNLIAVYVSAALGVFALLRWHRLGTFASLVPALVYAWSGAMIGQFVHLGVIQGYAFLPWALLSMLCIAAAVERTHDETFRRRVRAMAPSVLGLTLLWALTDLSGEPRAIAEMQLLLLIVGPSVLLIRTAWRPATWRNRATYVAGIATATIWGTIIGLGQLLPGYSFIKQSQRTDLTYQWFGAGSLYVKWSSLLFIPDIFGGNGLLHQPSFYVNYNLAEVTGYVGVLALVALFAFAGQLTRRGWRGENRQWILYVVLVVVGLFAAWGSFTPLGHLFRAIPLYGSTRLQSRSIIMVDLALVVLLGWFLQKLKDRDFVGAGLAGAKKWLTLAPALFIGALSLALMFFGRQIVNWMVNDMYDTKLPAYQRPTLLAHLVIACAFVVILLWGRKSKHLLRLISAFVALDIVLFLLFSATGFLPGRVNIEPSRHYAVQYIDPNGRFAMVDPTGESHYTFEDLGSTNMNVFTQLPSVQGYGSLIDELYGNVTDTHPLFGLDGCQLARGVYHQLRLSTVVVAQNKLSTRVTPTMVAPPQCVAAQRRSSESRYFGTRLPVARVRVRGVDGASIASDDVTAQLLNHKGLPFGPVLSATGAPSMTFQFSGKNVDAFGVRLSASGGVLVGSVQVSEPGHNAPTYALNTQFQQALSSPAWELVDTTGLLSYFRATKIRADDWLGTNAKTSRITNIRNSVWGDSWVSVAATHPTILKRSMEWIPGWRATARNEATGKLVNLHVVRSGLIQQVTVPAGQWTVHFHYHAPFITIGLIGSIGGGVTLVGAFAVLRGWVPRRRKGRVNG